MIEEQGQVVACEAGAVWVETVRRSTCGSCSARAGCGQALLQKVAAGARRGRIRVLCSEPLRVGEQVLIGVPEQAVLRGSVLVYLLPLLCLFAAAMLGQAAGLSEPWLILLAVAGLSAGLWLVRLLASRAAGSEALQPRVLRRLGLASEIIASPLSEPHGN